VKDGGKFCRSTQKFGQGGDNGEQISNLLDIAPPCPLCLLVIYCFESWIDLKAINQPIFASLLKNLGIVVTIQNYSKCAVDSMLFN
jgi:hypothetical protein